MPAQSRLRMVAGPNGSGKSTLLEWLTHQKYRLGPCLNPDILEDKLKSGGTIDFGAWGLDVTDEALQDFVARQAGPLDGRAQGRVSDVPVFHLRGTG